MRTNWASGDKVTAADLNEISTMLAGHDTTIAAHDGALSSQESVPVADDTDFAALLDPVGGGGGGGASGFYLVPAGQPAPTDLPDGVIVVMEDSTGGTAV